MAWSENNLAVDHLGKAGLITEGAGQAVDEPVGPPRRVTTQQLAPNLVAQPLQRKQAVVLPGPATTDELQYGRRHHQEKS